MHVLALMDILKAFMVYFNFTFGFGFAQSYATNLWIFKNLIVVDYATYTVHERSTVLFVYQHGVMVCLKDKSIFLLRPEN